MAGRWRDWCRWWFIGRQLPRFARQTGQTAREQLQQRAIGGEHDRGLIVKNGAVGLQRLNQLVELGVLAVSRVKYLNCFGFSLASNGSGITSGERQQLVSMQVGQAFDLCFFRSLLPLGIQLPSSPARCEWPHTRLL